MAKRKINIKVKSYQWQIQENRFNELKERKNEQILPINSLDKNSKSLNADENKWILQLVIWEKWLNGESV